MHLFMEIDYTLAHNIVYAGHDFALDFEIQAHKDFAITKAILEPDTDDVPMMEVHTGDASGKPHLIVESPGQYSEALAKLKRHAGEGGYSYTVRGDVNVDDPEDTEIDDAIHIDDFEEGEIMPLDAAMIDSADLLDNEKLSTRDSSEQLTLRLELNLRILKRLRPDLFDFDDAEDLPEYERHLAHDTADDLNGADPADGAEEDAAMVLVHRRIGDELMPLLEGEDSRVQAKVGELLNGFEGNMRAVSCLFEILMINKGFAVQPELIRRLQGFAGRFPYARLILALGALRCPGIVPGDHSEVYGSSDISELFPEVVRFHAEELCLYWAIRLLVAADAGDLPAALRFYSLISETDVFSIQLMYVQMRLFQLMEPVIEEGIAGVELDDPEDA